MLLVSLADQPIGKVLGQLHNDLADAIHPFARIGRMQIRFDGAEKLFQLRLTRAVRTQRRCYPD